MSVKTYIILSSLDKKRAFQTGATYPPVTGSGTQSAVIPKRSFALSNFEVSVGVARWLATLEIGSVRYRMRLRGTPSGISNDDTRNLVGAFYSGPISSAAYALESSNTAFSIPLSSLSDGVEFTVDLSNWAGIVAERNYFGLQIWIDGDDPAGVNQTILDNLEVDDFFTLTLAPVHLAIDTDETMSVFINRTLDHDFTFQHQDGNVPPLPMIAFQARYKRQSESTDDYVFVTLTQTTPLWVAVAGTFTAGADNTWVWSVRTKSQGQTDYGPWSANQTFIATADIETPTVTAPDGQISDPNPTITATSSESTRTAYQARARNQDTGAVVYDSMEVPGAGLSQIVSTNLTDGAYFADFRVKVDGAWSQYGHHAFTVVLDPPATPTLAAEPIPEGGYINLTYISQDPLELFVSPDYDVNNPGVATWESIVSGLAPSADGAVYQYFLAGNNESLSFKAVSHADGVSSEDSEIMPATLEIGVIWIHKLSDPAGSIMKFKANKIGGSDSTWRPKFTPEVSLHYFAGTDKPKVNRGEHDTETVSFTLQLVTDGSANDEDWQRLKSLLKVKERICVRTMEQDVVYVGSVTSVDGPFSDREKLQSYTVSFEMVITG